MPATINVNDKTVVHKSSGGIAVAFPDVCKTPTPGGPVPIPYPNIAKSADTAQGSQTVTMDGNPIMLKGSIYATSTGDEAGSVGGVISGVVKGKAEFLSYSFDVKAEGKNVCRLGDPMGQNEGSLNIGGSPTVQPPNVAKGKLSRKILVGKVTEITFKSGIDLHKDEKKELVPPSRTPHFKKGYGFPTYPAVYLMQSAGGAKNLTVTLEINDLENVSGSAELSGEGGGIKVKPKTFSLAKGTIGPLDMEFDTIPDEAVYFRQGIKWTVKAGGKDYPFGSTRVKLFFLYAKPKRPWTSTPVWQSVLEFLFLNVGVRGNQPVAGVKKIVQYCHSTHRRTYDTVEGGAHFGLGRSPICEVSRYIKRGPFRKVNCYDQARAVITLAAAVGAETEWIFMNPYGFINTTILVGVGSCNNPFFRMLEDGKTTLEPTVVHKSTTDPGTPPFWLVPIENRKQGRTAFGNHAFVRCSGKIYDACAGPHLGTEDPAAYIADAIDVSVWSTKWSYRLSWALGSKPSILDFIEQTPLFVGSVA